MNKSFLLLFAGLVMLISSCQKQAEADLIVVAGKIWTGDPNKPWASAIAIKNDTLLAVGTADEMNQFKGSATVVKNYEGNFVVPGFIDTHTHFMDGGFNLMSVQLRDAASPEVFIQRIAAYAATLAPGEWILGGDWDHENWGGVLPEASWIDSVTQNNPVFINRLDGHMALVNEAAMKAAGVTDQQQNIDGGHIERDKKGRLTGVFKDNAMDLFYKVVPAPSAERQMLALDTAMRYVASKGVTSVHHMNGVNEAFTAFWQEEKLITRLYVVGNLADWQSVSALAKERRGGDKWLKFGGVKGFVDGSLGSHTAAFAEPFSDSPLDSGFFINKEEDLYRWIKGADSAGLQVMVHAIGDKAIGTLLDLFEKVAKENGPRDRRFRIEHAQHIAPGDMGRFARLGVIASMQPYHAIDDGRWAERVIGSERIKTTYAFKSLMEAGAKVSFGSDWFVAPPTPLEGIYAAVTRRTLDGKNPQGWVPEQKINVESALRAYTLDAAYASFEEDIKGSLKPGKLADFVVLGTDLFSIAPEKIKDVEVVATYVGGKAVFNVDRP